MSADWKTLLPVTQDHEDLDGWAENDWRYDDGAAHALFSDEGDQATLHEMAANDEALAGARTGIGRALLQAFRPHFRTIRANGVGSPPYMPEDPPYERQPSFLFWRAMLREGLADAVILTGGFTITPDMLAGPIDTGRFVIEPDPLDWAGPRP